MSQLSNKKINKYFEYAKNASKLSNFHQHKLGAALIYKGNLIALGHNSTKTSPMQKHFNRVREDYDVEANYIHANSLHAEIACLIKVRNLNIDFSKVSIFIYRETKDGKPALSSPCRACRAAIRSMGINDIYYSTKNGWVHEHCNSICC